MTRRICFLTAAAVSLFVAQSATATSIVPVFDYAFPASFDGTGTVVADQSAAGNDASVGTAVLSANVPPGAAVGSQSLNTAAGGIRTVGSSLLTNSVIDQGLGFRYDVEFFWDGTTNNFDILKIVDYAGTESLQILVDDTGAGTLVMNFDDAAAGLALPVLPNEWVTASVVFTKTGPVAAGDLPGVATLTANGASVSAGVVKTAQGDGLGRPFGVGGFPAAPAIIQFPGDIHTASVSLLVPEPGAAVLLIVAAGFVRSRRR